MRLTRQEFITSSGLQGQTLDLWIEQQWLLPEQSPAGMQFSDIDVARARLIQELKNDMGANDEGIDVILHLMDQLHGMRRMLDQLRRTMRDPQP